MLQEFQNFSQNKTILSIKIFEIQKLQELYNFFCRNLSYVVRILHSLSKYISLTGWTWFAPVCEQM